MNASKLQASDSSSVQLDRAKHLIRQGDYKSAFLELNEALSKAPKDPNIHLNLGWLYLYTDDPKMAKAELEKVSKIIPDASETHHLRGSLYSYLNQQEDALQNFKKALSKAPKNSQLFFDIANSLTMLNRNEEALDYLDRGFEYIPDKDLQSHLNFLLASCGAHSKLKQFETAIEECTQAAEYTPDAQERQRILDMLENMKLIGQIEDTDREKTSLNQ